MMEIETIVSQPFAENTYVLWKPTHTEAIVIDPGLEPELIVGFLQQRGLRAVAILNTHGHADHIAGNAAMKSEFPEAPLVIGAGDAAMLKDPRANLSAAFGFSITSPPAERTVKEGDVVEAGGLELRVLDLPGHSPGHVVFVAAGAPIVVFGGDTLFEGSIGRTDFPGGSLQQLLTGIRTKLLALPRETLIYPGHGGRTSVGDEIDSNPFLQRK